VLVQRRVFLRDRNRVHAEGFQRGRTRETLPKTDFPNSSPPGTTTEVLRVGFPSEEIRVVSPITMSAKLAIDFQIFTYVLPIIAAPSSPPLRPHHHTLCHDLARRRPHLRLPSHTFIIATTYTPPHQQTMTTLPTNGIWHVKS
jgi:hypothetical protein